MCILTILHKLVSLRDACREFAYEVSVNYVKVVRHSRPFNSFAPPYTAAICRMAQVKFCLAGGGPPNCLQYFAFFHITAEAYEAGMYKENDQQINNATVSGSQV